MSDSSSNVNTSSKKSLRPAEVLAPVPAVMVTCGEEGRANIITIAWTGIVNSIPPMVYISVMPRRYSHDIIAKTGEFTINLVGKDQADWMDYCGTHSGRDVDKWAETGMHPEPGTAVSCPGIAECPVQLECKVLEVREFRSHDMFIGEVVNVRADPEYLDEKGNIDYGKIRPVSYCDAVYYLTEAEPFANFGYTHKK